MGWKRTWSVFALGVALFAAPQLAEAQKWDMDKKINAWGDLALHSGGGALDVFAFSPMFGGAFRFGDFAADLKLPLAYASVSGGMQDASAFRIANPWLGGHLLGDAGIFNYRVGLGVALPLATIPDDSAEDAAAAQYAYAYGTYMRGNWDPWLFRPDTFTVAVPARLEMDLFILKFGADAGLGAMIATSKSQDTDFTGQLGADAAFSILLFDVGARLQGVWMFTADGDNFQASIEPFARLDLGIAWADLRFLINLDEPAGFAFDSGKIWGLRIGGGVTL